jgi:hypothetical protein
MECMHSCMGVEQAAGPGQAVRRRWHSPSQHILAFSCCAG